MTEDEMVGWHHQLDGHAPHCTSLGPGTAEACILLSSGIMGGTQLSSPQARLGTWGPPFPNPELT